jgi:trigger factor
LELSAEDSAKYLDEAIDHFSKTVKAKGFRPGKIPRSFIIKQCFPQIRKRLIELHLSTLIYEAIKEHQLDPISTPIIEEMVVVDGQPISCVASFDLYPTFELPPLESITLTKPRVEVSDVDVTITINNLRAKQAVIKTIDEDRPLAKGDIADLSYEIFLNSKLVTFKKDEKPLFSMPVDEDTEVFPEISQAIVGLKVGETRDVELVMPKHSPQKNIAGKKVTFRVKALAIRQREVPELDDEFAKDTGYPEVTDVASLREFVTKELIKDRDERLKTYLQSELIYKISQLVDIEIPEAVLDNQTLLQLDTYKKNLVRRFGENVDLSQYINEEFVNGTRRGVAADLRQTLILEKVRAEKNFSMTDQDLENELLEITYITGQPLDKIKAHYPKDGERYQGLQTKVESQKAFDYLLSQVTIKESEEPLANPAAPAAPLEDDQAPPDSDSEPPQAE